MYILSNTNPCFMHVKPCSIICKYNIHMHNSHISTFPCHIHKSTFTPFFIFVIRQTLNQLACIPLTKPVHTLHNIINNASCTLCPVMKSIHTYLSQYICPYAINPYILYSTRYCRSPNTYIYIRVTTCRI